MTLGLVSDTHGYLDPQVEKIFAGVDLILHAGDIGPDLILSQLGAIAPVVAVLGNNDSSPAIPLTQAVTLNGRKFLIHHIVFPHALQPGLKTRLARERPDVVVFGHSHKRFHELIGGVHFLNPGYAGKPRFNQPRSVALLDCAAKELCPRFVAL